MNSATVLIAGAGPTGLMLALQLARRGIAVRIIDKNSGPGLASRAMAVHARTLEFYRQLGCADALVAQGIPIDTIHLREDDKEIARLPLRDIGAGISPYPFVLAYPQDDHERFLVGQLHALGVEVEWEAELESFTHDEEKVQAVLQRRGVRELCTVPYLCGCDGARSRVREQLRLDFAGGTYGHLYFVADVKLSGPPNKDLVGQLSANTFVLMLPVRSTGMQRLIGIMPDEAAGKADASFEDVRAHAEGMLGVRVDEVNWFSTYRVHHRVAAQFRRGRCFLAGDAAHIHSPAGGQGMNTGIGDAVNLGWKIAQVLQGRAASALLNSYEAERMPFARALVATTDHAFSAIVAPGLGGQVLRHWLLPSAAPLLAGFASARRALFKTISQVQIHYPDSKLSAGRAGEVLGGDRLPWVADGVHDNFDALHTMDWQLHVYGTPTASLMAEADGLTLPLVLFPWSPQADRTGLMRDAAYLVRPDGYVALSLPRQEAGALPEFAARLGLRFGPRPSPL